MVEKVAMVHPDLPNTKDNPRIESKKGFEKVWSKRGWKLAPADQQPNAKTKKEKK
ncbi:MAG: hypothetical protein ACLFVZ_08420 [Actinomycetota bacterium]